MRKFASFVVLIAVFMVAAALQFPAQAQAAAECTLCVGRTGNDGSVVPAFTRLDEASYPSFTPVQSSNVSVLIEYEAHNVDEVEQKTRQILEWARTRGAFAGLAGLPRRAAAPVHDLHTRPAEAERPARPPKGRPPAAPSTASASRCAAPIPPWRRTRSSAWRSPRRGSRSPDAFSSRPMPRFRR